MFPLTIYFFTFVPRAANVTDWLIMQLATQDFFSSVSPPSTKRQKSFGFFFQPKDSPLPDSIVFNWLHFLFSNAYYAEMLLTTDGKGKSKYY